MALRGPTVLPVALLAMGLAVALYAGAAFVPGPQSVTAVSPPPQARFLQAAAASSAAALVGGALPALAEEIDAAEAYNRKLLTGSAYVLALSAILVGIIVSQARKLVDNKWLN
mmetsp:Transcript_60526/g.184907  ORF Transcript_60526/g.184907 Transcript_60526/m.184907 type:complete len:113 (-) Transcript_60526:14-352(-)